MAKIVGLVAQPVKYPDSLDKAGRFLNEVWIVAACRKPKRGEHIYLPLYDRIIKAPADGVGCAVIVVFKNNWEKLLALALDSYKE